MNTNRPAAGQAPPYPSIQELEKLRAHDGMSLMAHRALNKLVTGIQEKAAQIPLAAQADFNNVTRTKELAPQTVSAMEGISALIGEVRQELHDLERYWYSLPWSAAFGHSDPRSELSPEEEASVMAAVEEQAAYQRKCACSRDETNQPVSGLAGGKIGGAYHTVVDAPGPDFDPELLAAKKVVLLDFKSDVRTSRTVGQSKVDYVVGGPPVLWFIAADDTRVALLQEDLSKVANLLRNVG